MQAARSRDEVRVLVVEDDPDSAESLRNLLALYGFQVRVARSCQEGLAEARKLEPHVVVCDIGLPDTDGYSVASMLRQSTVTGEARLIAVTGRGDPRDRRRALAAGFDQYLLKPVDPEVLLRELELTV